MEGTKTRFGFAAALVAVVVLSAACGSDGDTGGGEPPAAGAPAIEPFGTACSDIPPSGEGSFEAMMTQPVVTAAAANPLLSMLVADLEEAQLTDTLNGAQDLTVFAPTDDAFDAAAAADPQGMQAMMADPTGAFAQLLTYHVVEGQLAPEALVGEHTTLQGQSLSVQGGGREFTVNGTAMVVCGDIHTDNATVYVIDEVLHPPTA